MIEALERAGYVVKWAGIGVGLIFGMMFVAFPIGVGLIFLWEAILTAVTEAFR